MSHAGYNTKRRGIQFKRIGLALYERLDISLLVLYVMVYVVS